MKRAAAVLVVMLTLTSSVNADPATASRARNALADLLSASTDLSKEATRDAEILRLLVESGRSLDDFQKNVAVSKALDAVSKAEQLANRPPVANAKVFQAIRVAHEIIDPARESPTSANLPQIRAQLRARPIEWMRQVVADESGTLARLMLQITEISGLVARSLASATSAALGQPE